MMQLVVNAEAQSVRVLNTKDLAKAGALATATTKPRVLLLANDAKDLELHGQGMAYSELLTSAGAEVYVLPASFLAQVPEAQRERVIKTLVKKFSSVMALDGADVSPKIYDRYNTHSENVNPERDAFEALILKAAIDSNAFVMGIGRGHHLIAALQGMQILQDIHVFLNISEDHSQAEQTLGQFATSNKLLAQLLPGLATGEVKVISSHHQGVLSRKNANLEVAAISADGVVEALEFRNGRGVSVQFQLDKLPESQAKVFFARLVQMIQGNASKAEQSCETLLAPAAAA